MSRFDIDKKYSSVEKNWGRYKINYMTNAEKKQ